MRILFVCFPYSVHAARWTRLLDGAGWDLHVFPSQLNDYLHPAFQNVTFWPTGSSITHQGPSVRVEQRPSPELKSEEELADHLAETIRQGEFDLVHSLEFQHAGYLTLKVAEWLGGNMPNWIATNYGSDIYLYGRDPDHKRRIRELLARCDYYGAECRRDLDLARRLGFRKQVFAIEPNGGGVDQGVVRLAEDGPTSDRRVVAVKGYQHFAGRALTALDALRRCRRELTGYEVVVYGAFPEVVTYAEQLRSEGIAIQCLPEQVPHEEILRLHGRSRISLAISISDGISTSMLEAMAMGSFPIQTSTSCANEWIKDGDTGFIVDPGNVSQIARRLKRALTDDSLVDAAAPRNAVVIRERANPSSIRRRVEAAYLRAAA